MKMRHLAAIGLLIIACAGVSLSAPQDNRTGGPSDAILGNLDALVDNYSLLLVRKYDLDDQQAEFTKKLLHERVKSFFAAHEREVRELMDQMFNARAGGEMDQGSLIEWGKRVEPLFEEAKQVITQSNNDWRQILTDDQRKIHDKDVELMNESFDTTQQQLQRLVSGEMTVEEFRNPFRPTRGPRARPRPTLNPPAVAANPGPTAEPAPSPHAKPTDPASGASMEEENAAAINRQAGEARPPRVTGEGRDRAAEEQSGRPERGSHAKRGDIAKPVSDKDFAGKWEQYVRDFIARYQLDEGQKQRAEAYLKDCVQQGDRYVQTKVSLIEKVDTEIAELAKSSDKNKAAQVAKLNEQRKKLFEPLDRIFEQQLKPRLDKLPTRAQRAAAEANDKKPPAKAEKEAKDAAKPAAKPKQPTKDDE